MKTTLERIFAGLAVLLICTGASPATDLHPIVEIESGFLFGAISDGKWIKADETAKLIGDETIPSLWIDAGTWRRQSRQTKTGGGTM